jgi:hypothetical protein
VLNFKRMRPQATDILLLFVVKMSNINVTIIHCSFSLPLSRNTSSSSARFSKALALHRRRLLSSLQTQSNQRNTLLVFHLMQLRFNVVVVGWLAAGLLFLLVFFLVCAALISRRQCWRMPPSSTKHTPSCTINDLPRPFVLQSLPPNRRRDAAVLAARAFCNSPAYVHILRGDNVFRLEALVWLFERNITLVQNASPLSDPTFCLFSTSGSLLSFFWLLPAAASITLYSKIRAGLLSFPLIFGCSPFLRLLTLSDQFDKITHAVLQKNIPVASERCRALVLERMVVEPTLQGRGLGSSCIKSALPSDASIPIVLTTQLQSNVEFYSRLGFRVVHEERVGCAADPFSFRSWWMLRFAAAASPTRDYRPRATE